MPTFEITAPDGRVFEVTGPEGSTKEQALAKVKAAYAPQVAKAKEKAPDPTEGMSGTEKFLAGMGKGMTDVGRGIGQLVGVVSPQDVAEARARDAALSNTGAGFAGDIAGNLALTMVPGARATSALARVGAQALPKAAAVMPTTAAGVVGAGLAAGTTPLTQDEPRLNAAAMGAGGAVAGDLAVRGAARLAQPMIQSPQVQALMAKGVVPTPGQAAGADSMLGRAEQKLESVFGVGDIVKHGRDRAATEFNVAAGQKALPEGKLTETGQAAMERIRQGLDDAYSKVFAGKVVQPDQSLAQAIVAARQSTTLPLSEASEKTFDRVLKRVLWDRIPTKNVSTGGPPGTAVLPAGVVGPATGQMGGSVLVMPADKMKQEIIGDLGKVARQHLNSSTAEEKALGEALMAARNAAQDWLKGEVAKTSPAAAQQLSRIDQAYANRVMVFEAMERAKAAGYKFTPNQLQRSARQGTDMRQLADDAQAVIGSRVPNSGTVDRATLAFMLGGGGAGANEYFGGPGYLTALGLSPLLYSRMGSRYMLGGYPGQAAGADLLRSLSPFTAQVGRDVANR